MLVCSIKSNDVHTEAWTWHLLKPCLVIFIEDLLTVLYHIDWHSDTCLPCVQECHFHSQSRQISRCYFDTIVFKHPVALIYILYTYTSISIVSATDYVVTILPHYMFRLYTTIIRCLSVLLKLFTVCQNYVSHVNAIFPS
jgi:hypothetical protein